MDREAWHGVVHGIAKSEIQLSDWTELNTVKGFGEINKAEVDVFLELSCLFCDPSDVGNLISGFSAFSKSILIIWKFLVHKLMKPGLENFEHYFASVWGECKCTVVWKFFDIVLWEWNEKWSFPVLWSLLSFPNLLAYSVNHFHSSIFRIWHSSSGIPPPSLALSIVMLPKAHLTLHSKISDSSWVTTPLWLSGSWKSFLYSSSVYSCHLLIFYASVRSMPFMSFILPMFTWNVPLVFLVFLKGSLVFWILLFSSIFLHWSLRKSFLSLLAILWHSAFTSFLFSFVFSFSSFLSYL